MDQTPLADSLLNGMSAIARSANSLMIDKANHSEMLIFHMLMIAERETGCARVQLSRISRELCVSRPAVTQCVDRLVAREFLIRCSDSEDRRAVYVELTEKGREYFNMVREKALEVIDRIILNMGEENAKQLALLLGKLKNAVIEETDQFRSKNEKGI